MNKPAPTFRPIASPLDDISDDDLGRLVDKLAVPTLVKPEPPPAPASKAAIIEPSLSPSQGAASRTAVKSPRRPPAPEADNESPAAVKVSVDLPEYIYRAMRVRVAEEQSTMRYLVMQGLQAIGIRIDPRDFVSDGRSTRSRTN
jgi:hypothetical protein